MKRPAVLWSIAGVLLALLGAWISRNTEFVDTKVPMPPKGEALTNPFYAAQRFVETLGARSVRDHTLTIPRSDAVIVLSAWHWSLGASRRQAIERWVESGGRLVVDQTLVGGGEDFERWSKIVRESRKPEEWKRLMEQLDDENCRGFYEPHDGSSSRDLDPAERWICDAETMSFLKSDGPVAWALADESGIQVMRVRVGRGSVTRINAMPFRQRAIFDGDHGWLLVSAAELRRGDEVHFLSEDEQPSLLALLWHYGGPVVVLALAIAALVLWRGWIRFGPLVAPDRAERRSLAEQIRGTGQFALRHGSGESLHAACVRALDEAARRRLPGYIRLSAKERASAVARRTGF